MNQMISFPSFLLAAPTSRKSLGEVHSLQPSRSIPPLQNTVVSPIIYSLMNRSRQFLVRSLSRRCAATGHNKGATRNTRGVSPVGLDGQLVVGPPSSAPRAIGVGIPTTHHWSISIAISSIQEFVWQQQQWLSDPNRLHSDRKYAQSRIDQVPSIQYGA